MKNETIGNSIVLASMVLLFAWVAFATSTMASQGDTREAIRRMVASETTVAAR